MPKGKDINTLLKPLVEKKVQAYFGQGLHTLGLLHWILGQTGRASVFVSSYSTSEPFLNGFYLLRKKGKIERSMLMLDHRAARKTVQLEQLMSGAFDNVFLGQNHSKVLLIHNKDWQVSVVTSQNQTYGDRAESTIIITDKDVYTQLLREVEETIVRSAVEIDIKNGQGIITESGGSEQTPADSKTDWQPFGAEW